MDPTEASVTLVNVIENKPVKTVVSKKDIDEMLPSAVSLMPEKLLDTLSYQEIRDLFAYMQTEPKKDAPPPAKDPANPPRPRAPTAQASPVIRPRPPPPRLSPPLARPPPTARATPPATAPPS